MSGMMTGLSARLVDMAAEFDIPTTRAGVLYSLHFGGFMSCILLSLAVHGLRGRLLLARIAAAAYVAALAAAAGAPGLVLAGAALFAAGGCGGVLESHTATLQVMTAESEAEAGRVVTITQVFFAVGALLAPCYLALELPGGWRSLFGILAATAMATFFAGTRIRADRFDAAPPDNGRLQWRPLLRTSAALLFYVGAEITLFGWIPTVMETYHGIPAVRARLAPSVFWAGMLAGRLLVAHLTHRVRPRPLLLGSAALGILASVLLAILPGEGFLWGGVVLASLASAGIWPLVVATSGGAGHETGTTIAIAAGGLGAAVFPYLAGRTAEFLPGRFIPIMAAPLFLAVLLLSLHSKKHAERTKTV
mgnify:CR=1 FL=1